MTTDYDPIAEQYKLSKQQPWRAFIEAYTFMDLIGDPSGKSVIDLACGEGFYSRLLRQRGAEKVSGIDLSPRMIELARKEESDQRLGIEYFVGDARALTIGAQYDLAVAAYLLNYAHDRAELGAMCRGIADCLKPGGRFVTVNSSPLLDFSAAPSYRKYGFEARIKGEAREGAPITWTFFLDHEDSKSLERDAGGKPGATFPHPAQDHDGFGLNQSKAMNVIDSKNLERDAGGKPGSTFPHPALGEESFDIENYFLDVAVHEEVFRSAGFRDISWHRPRLSPDGEATHGRDFWDGFLEHSPISFIECFK